MTTGGRLRRHLRAGGLGQRSADLMMRRARFERQSAPSRAILGRAYPTAIARTRMASNADGDGDPTYGKRLPPNQRTEPTKERLLGPIPTVQADK